MKSILKIIKLARPLYGWITFACILIAIQAALQQATPITLKFVVDELSKQITGGRGNYEYLIYLFGLILVINIVSIGISAVGQRLGDFISSRLGRYLAEIYYRKIFTLPQVYFDSELSGKIVNQLNRGILSIRVFIGQATNWILPSILQAIFGIAILAYFNVKIALFALAVFPFCIVISNYSTKRWGKIQADKNVYEDESRGRIGEVVSNIKLVKTYNTQKKEWDFISGKYQIINRLYDRQSLEYHIINFIREFGLEIAFVSILFIIFRQTFFGGLTLGEMVLVIQILTQLRWPLYGMSYILEQAQQASADAKEFLAVLDIPDKEKFEEGRLPKLAEDLEISFENVSFSYQGGAPVFTNINLTFKNKECVALVGHSGAGKTTLINLILALYEPTSGKIALSGKNYEGLSHAWIREHSALVFQDSELFSSTIRENVAYGRPEAAEEQIIDALKKANAYDFAMKLNGGLDAKIGERGVKLSGGQRQRIQIARAILHDKPILILDEATSSLDSKSERLVQEALERLFKDRLVIIIAHRFSTIQNADRIVVLDNGMVADSGSPAELAGRKGIYSELLQYQIEGNKKLLSQYELG